MPELPEVEIHARNLRVWAVGRAVRRAQVLDPMLGRGGSGWERDLEGREVLGVEREAKYLLLALAGERTLVAHLRMTGRFLRDDYVATDPAPPTRFALDLEDGVRLRFEDRRRFGRLWACATSEARRLPELAGLGPDALRAPTSAERLAALAAASRRPIKTLLMDQRLIGGLGNICAIEILHRTRIHPDTPAAGLAPGQVRALATLIPEYLEWAIEAQSRRELIYIGEKGAVNVFGIYRREGTPCPACGTAIVRTVTAGRGTWWCPACQPPTAATGAAASGGRRPDRRARSARAAGRGTPGPGGPRSARRSA